MDRSSQQEIKDFENLLKNNVNKISLALYSGNKTSSTHSISYSARDIIAQVNKQIKDLQKADTAQGRSRDKNKLVKHKKCSFLPVNMLPKEYEVTNYPANKFETQCVSDSQLIDIIDNAEAVAETNNGITQEFDSTFYEVNDKTDKSFDKNESSIIDKGNAESNCTQRDSFVHNSENVLKNSDPKDLKEKLIPFSEHEVAVSSQNVENIGTKTQIDLCNSLTESMDRSQALDETSKNNPGSRKEGVEFNVNIKKQKNNLIEDEVVSPSPVFQVPRSKTPSPLVFDLHSFEKFEKIALPIIEENTDFSSAKRLINSQIIGRELVLQTNVMNEHSKNNQMSPVLKICTDKLKISKIPENTISNSQEIKNSVENKKEKNNPYIEDEILFSSDEEDEYLQKELQDIPLTCALETSFYDQPNVLDKTMYVGFQTASNKSIQITSDSFAKAKSVLDEIEKDVANTNITDLVESLCSERNDSNCSPKVFGKSKSNHAKPSTAVDLVDNIENNSRTKTDHIETNTKNNSQKLIDQEIEILKRPEKRKFDGFMTASKKKIKLSDIALARCKRVFQDIGLEEAIEEDQKDIEYINNKEFETDRHSEIDEDILQEFSRDMSMMEEKRETLKSIQYQSAGVKDNTLPDTKNNIAVDYSDIVHPPKEVEKFCGFKIASCKDIIISNEAVIKSKKIFEDLIEVKSEDQISSITVQETNSNNIPHKEELNPRYSDGNEEKQTDLKIKELNVEKNAIDINEDISTDFENEMLDVDTSYKPVSLSLCGNFEQKPNLSVLKKCHTEGDDKFKHHDTNAEESHTFVKLPSISSEVQFKTASNKMITISSRAIEKSKKIFENIDVEYNKEGTLANVKHSESKENNILESKSCDGSKFQCFKTASNKKINVRPEALAKSKALFNDIDFENIPIESTKDKDFNKTDEILGFKGFQTASKKPISISTEALRKSKALFKDLNNDGAQKTDPSELFDESKANFQGFQTASNKIISVSSEALAKSKALLNKIDSNCLDQLNEDSLQKVESVQKFIGFHTASNKSIGVSSDALAKSKAVFKDFNFEEGVPEIFDSNSHKAESIPKFTGFQTASNKTVSVSSEALAKTKMLLSDIDNEYETKKTDSMVFEGFKTASRKPVSVSAEALHKSKTLFKDMDQDIVNTNFEDPGKSFVGFKTANQKPIAISSDALVKSAALFKDMDSDTENVNNFKGFQTANNKTVEVSKDALLKSKNIFEDIESVKVNEIKSNVFKGFQTASNKKVNISEQALKKTREIFNEIDLNYKENVVEKDSVVTVKENIQKIIPFGIKTANGNNIKVDTESLNKSKKAISANKQPENRPKLEKQLDKNFEKLLDTQIINDFEQTVCTEDFCKDETPKRSKRSGSPILSCPRAKKRKKFETPWTPNRNNEKFNVINVVPAVPNQMNSEVFSNDYKKRKRYKLKDLAKVEIENKNKAVDPYILNFSLDTLLEFEFSGKRNDVTKEKFTVEELKDTFERVVNKQLIPVGWLDNHIKLIMWKLISYEIKFPNTLTKVCTPKNIIEQLKYRFDRELYNAERPALRKILEKDDVASKTMVLCIAGIIEDGNNVQSVTNINSTIELLVTDGWYCIKACIDKMLTKLVYDEKITIGSKIVTCGAELINCEQGVAPWEDTSSVRLKMFGNSTRRARWDARLGYHGNAAILTPLSSVKPEGGKVSKLRLFVARAYPMLYVEKFEDGSTVTRSERLESIHQVKYEAERHAIMEKVYEEVEKELSDQESQDSLDAEIAAKQRRNCDYFRITESQARSLEDKTNKKRERLLQNVQERVRRKIEEKGLNTGRNVVTLFKVRVAGFDDSNEKICITKGFMSIWKPNELLTEIIKEGTWIEVMNVVPTAVRYSEIHLSAGRNSVFSQIKNPEDFKSHTNSLMRKCYHIKDLIKNSTMSTDYNEIDTIGLIFQIDEDSNQSFQNVYLTDIDKNIICINFWGGLKKFGFQNVLEIGQVVYGMNLQKRAGNTRKSIPHFRVTEFTNFTKTPKNELARNLIRDFEKKFANINKRKFCEECVTFKNNISTKSVTENVSPYRFNNDHNLSKNKVFVDSPLAAKCEDIFNLTGLDFESTFKQKDTQEMSPKMLQRKRMMKQKIAKLKMIGEPPPLSPLNIINKSRTALNSYRSPLAQTSVARTKQIDQNSSIEKDIPASPIIQTDVNKSYQNNVSSVQSYQLSRISKGVTSCEKGQNKQHIDFIHSSPIVQANVTSLKKSYRNSRMDDIQSSPVISMNRTYVKVVNPVKLNFSNQDNSLEEVEDQFAEEFDGSPPLSLD